MISLVWAISGIRTRAGGGSVILFAFEDTAMRRNQLIRSLLAGLAFALLTWLILGDHLGSGPPWLGQVIVTFLTPGLFVGIVVSGNIHIENVGIVVAGNFLFYFAVTYFFLGVLAKRQAKSNAAFSSVLPSAQDRS